MIGTKLASYEITARLGSGGMGEVYEAIDSKLGRNVAIKFLPDAFTHDSERIARLQREARVLASLNHPNIAAIYGLEETDGRHFLVMELVPGETIAERLKRGPIELDDALEIAGHIAEALEAAHDKGVVHRDLKPANVKVASDGKVKVLDFGLAKAIETEAAAVTSSNSPTMSMASTQQGVILGTAAYMSPEQARGKAVDKRTDIWAFGVVLYEMITRKPLFEGEDLTETLASVVKQQPDLTALPLKVRRVIEKCLQKDPKKRLRDISSVALLLEDELIASPQARQRIPVYPWAIAAVFGIAFAVVLWAPWRSDPVSPEPVFFQFSPPERSIFGSGIGVSPDGRHVAFIARSSDGSSLVWIRSLNAPEARSLPGTEGAGNRNELFWSPDSRWIGFATFDRLKKVEVTGGPPQTICELPFAFRGGAWNRDGGSRSERGRREIDDLVGRRPQTAVASRRQRTFLPLFKWENDGRLRENKRRRF
jgi:serine/threonine protein kinase